MNKAVAALSWSAGTAAFVGVDIVAIIAAFTGLNGAIAAAGRLTISAGISGVLVAIITPFARTDVSITTVRFDAVTEAGVIVVLVAIVAGFESGSVWR